MLLIRKLIKNKRGQALVELALALPLIFMLVMGTIEFGRLFHSYLLITNASREGARIAITGADDLTIIARVNDVTSSLNNTKEIDIIPEDPSVRFSGSSVKVTVDYKHNIITPVLNSILPNPVKLTSSTSMRMEGKN
ncbi:TadE/TadG family type IV pilus assembly protein [Pelotomaculum propionicicum]|uniref:TadE/TadG family type IV pilus assembly protein n=1 Tax=Pelotomaculum propionicicum TaxID=258475 RepID=UPI003B829246